MTATKSTKKQDILNTSLRLFYLRGFNNIGVDRIIFESKVAKMTFYSHFKSKNILIKACLAYEIKNIQTSILEKISQESELDYLSQLISIIKWFYENSRKQDYNSFLLYKAQVELDKELYFEASSIYYNWLEDLIHEKLIQLQITQPKTKTNLILTIINGLNTRPSIFDSELLSFIEKSIIIKN
ncbi:Transcriptional regulator, TetR family [Acinetobacter junii CIP 107470 = MTCC 11364]|uniref:Transcriptional regulator, TetR family n=1 Tax=Acinetobacter junii CIP 107470 = MTCC 11364 TaxID=1217666 RepID=S7YFR2_ACIJU|nr:TetR/AcrR family transcriptional regulator [Acinetobacter junii]ENV52087.1 hypothetical protein F953_00499 [Acinetobacter junii CIP 107470 = MTCC 11364]EPR86863.1 Transcriptional regulator, TetR family [Acinetobacter junii CIP 107470 = MTCC 11364]